MEPFHKFMTPALKLAADGNVWRLKTLRDATVDAMNLSESELAETLSRGVPRAVNRAGWAIEHLCQGEALTRPYRGHVQITDLGRRLLAEHPEGVTYEVIAATPGVQDWTRRSKEAAEARRRDGGDTGSIAFDDGEVSDASPIEQLIEALTVLDLQTGSALIERLREQPPIFLEKAVLKLLHAMGYGGSAADGEHLGKSHDGGLDGVIRQDALGIERVYVQAKRYKADNTVGAAAVREFAGALADAGASGGVLITTSSFSPDARKFAERNPRIVLIDGIELGRLMVKYEVGVAITQKLRVTEVDENFFEAE